jgi:hypothetical protein
MVMVDGQVQVSPRSEQLPPPERTATIVASSKEGR